MATSSTTRLTGVAGALAIKAPVRVATTTNITLSGAQTIDGVAAVAEDRVLVKDQTDGTENGIYDVSSGDWTRAVDFNGNRDVTEGTRVLVNQGSVNAATEWYVSTTGTITIGTTSITFTVTSLGSTGEFGNGTEAAPAMTFAADPDTGWYRIAANNIGLAIGGTKLWDIVAGGVTQAIGNLNLTLGNITLAAGNFVATLGDLIVTAGNITVTLGSVTVTAGNIDAPLGTVDALAIRENGGLIVPTAAVMAYTLASAPAGWLMCDGAAVSRTTYSVLFAALGTIYGVGDGSTTFNVPNYEGEFLRGTDNGVGNDPDAASRTDRGDGTTGDAVGTKQLHALQDHDHQYDKASNAASQDPGSSAWTSNTDTASDGVNTSGAFTPLVSTNETRARNVGVNWIIKI